MQGVESGYRRQTRAGTARRDNEHEKVEGFFMAPNGFTDDGSDIRGENGITLSEWQADHLRCWSAFQRRATGFARVATGRLDDPPARSCGVKMAGRDGARPILGLHPLRSVATLPIPRRRSNLPLRGDDDSGS